jgi:hypothetical protein
MGLCGYEVHRQLVVADLGEPLERGAKDHRIARAIETLAPVTDPPTPFGEAVENLGRYVQS